MQKLGIKAFDYNTWAYFITDRSQMETGYSSHHQPKQSVGTQVLQWMVSYVVTNGNSYKFLISIYL